MIEIETMFMPTIGLKSLHERRNAMDTIIEG